MAGLFLPVGPIHAQSTETVTATCKDALLSPGQSGRALAAVTGGVQSWGKATSSTSAPSQAAPTTSRRATPSVGGVGQVWVNIASKGYHSPGTRWYGKTKQGSYMSEAEARAQGIGRTTARFARRKWTTSGGWPKGASSSSLARRDAGSG
jgi:hypothetical protein